MCDKPERLARNTIDELLVAAGWQVHDRKSANITAGRGVAIREFPLKPGYGFADYMLYVDGAAAGVVEAKKDGLALTGVELQTSRYSLGLPDDLPAPRRPLPFLYQATSKETRFTSLLDPDAASRAVFPFHLPHTPQTPRSIPKRGVGRHPTADGSSLRALGLVAQHERSKCHSIMRSGAKRSPDRGIRR